MHATDMDALSSVPTNDDDVIQYGETNNVFFFAEQMATTNPHLA